MLLVECVVCSIFVCTSKAKIPLTFCKQFLCKYYATKQVSIFVLLLVKKIVADSKQRFEYAKQSNILNAYSTCTIYNYAHFTCPHKRTNLQYINLQSYMRTLYLHMHIHKHTRRHTHTATFQPITLRPKIADDTRLSHSIADV